MTIKFNINQQVLFKIDNFMIGEKINITTLDNKFLSIDEKYNIVEFSETDNISDRQNFIIEVDDNDSSIYYIKASFERYNYTQYLGSPNSDDIVYLYTSKNKYTKWNIRHQKENIYSIQYFGEKFNPLELSIIVARYNEYIEWVLPYNDIAIIYNKGNFLDLPFKNIIYLNNIGREGNTYLHHIINNYNNLSQKCIFTQGDPFPHNNTILFGIDNYEKTDEIQPLGLKYTDEFPEREFVEKYKITTNYGLVYSIFLIDNNLHCPDFTDNGMLSINESHYRRYPEDNSICEGFLKRSKFPIEKSLEVIKFNFCALFSITSAKIKKHDVSIYENLIRELTIFYHQGGDNGYILERLWLYIFDY